MKAYLFIYFGLVFFSCSVFSENNIDDEFLLNLELFENYNIIKDESPQNINEEDLDVFFESDEMRSQKNEGQND